MLYSKVEVLYGIDYDIYARGGIGNVKLFHMGSNRELFTEEKEMLHRFADLKCNSTYDNIELFTTKIAKESYKL